METSDARLSPLRTVFQGLKGDVDRVIGDFYRRLLEARPDFAHFFASTDWPKQRRMLLSSLVLAIENIEEPQEVLATLRAFGRTHEPFGLSGEDYRQFGAILHDTLRDAAGAAWTPAVDAEWQEAYKHLVATMRG